MALEICLECGKEISTYAGMCPGCGFPQIDFKESIYYKNYPKGANLVDVAYGLLVMDFDYEFASEILNKEPFLFDKSLISQIKKYFDALDEEVQDVYNILFQNHTQITKYTSDLFLSTSKKMFEASNYRGADIMAELTLELDENNPEATLISFKSMVNYHTETREVTKFISESESISINEIQKEFKLEFDYVVERILKPLMEIGCINGNWSGSKTPNKNAIEILLK